MKAHCPGRSRAAGIKRGWADVAHEGQQLDFSWEASPLLGFLELSDTVFVWLSLISFVVICYSRNNYRNLQWYFQGNRERQGRMGKYTEES